MGDTTNLHGDSGRSKTNNNFGGILKALRREHQGDMVGMGSMEIPPATATATVTSSSYDSGYNTDSGGRDEKRRANKERKRRKMREKRREERERSGTRGGV